MSSLIKQNKNADAYKVIAIKDLSVSQETFETITNVNEEDHLDRLTSKIFAAKEELAQLEEKKRQLLSETKEKIVKEREDWQAEKEMERQKAEEEGFQKGYEEGKNDALERYESLVEKANTIYLTSVEDYHKTIKKHTETIIQLAMKVAEKIMNMNVKEHPENFSLILHKALDQLKVDSTITIHIHPNNYPFVQQQKEELEQLLDGEKNIILQMDHRLNEGDCMIKHRFGQIDVGVDVQLEQIKAALLEHVLES